jgi:hypothetical protein
MHIQNIAVALGGVVSGPRSVNIPGPGHSAADRSLSVKFGASINDFICHSLAGDDDLLCKDFVRERLGLEPWRPGHSARRHLNESQRAMVAAKLANLGEGRPSKTAPIGAVSQSEAEDMPQGARADLAPIGARSQSDAADKIRWSRALFNESVDPLITPAETYFRDVRGLCLPEELAGRVVRYHPRLRLDGAETHGILIAFRDIHSNELVCVQRIFLDGSNRKIERRFTAPSTGAVAKLTPHTEVTYGLTIGEGFESTLAGYLAGFRPTWCAGSANAIGTFPILGGVETITLLGERKANGDPDPKSDKAVRACADRYIAAGREARAILPKRGDMADLMREIAA